MINMDRNHYRLMNTSGVAFRDHAVSMVRWLSPASKDNFLTLQDLCNAALDFADQHLKPGGSFICKFYQGSEDRVLEQRLKTLFARVQREKPESSRKVPLDPSLCTSP